MQRMEIKSHIFMFMLFRNMENGPDWGGPFKDDRTPVILSEEEYIRRVEQIREHLT